MKLIIGALSGIVVLVIAVIIVVDATTAPTASTGQCILVRRTVLPDYCANSCSPPFDCTRTRRPYGVFFSQAASCMDGVIC